MLVIPGGLVRRFVLEERKDLDGSNDDDDDSNITHVQPKISTHRPIVVHMHYWKYLNA